MLACSYAFHFNGSAMKQMINATESALVKGQPNVGALMAAAHSALSALKSTCTIVRARHPFHGGEGNWM